MPGKKGAAKAEAKPASQPESQEEKQVAAQEEVQKDVEDTKAPEAAAVEKRGRGRPKKDGAEPTVKKPKKEKERTEPSRVSQRVASMKTGASEPAPVAKEEPKKKAKVTKKAQPTGEEKQELSANNGTTEQAVAS